MLILDVCVSQHDTIEFFSNLIVKTMGFDYMKTDWKEFVSL